ncbi:hypothetical protein GCM10009430_15070 [Aquimarina litoralis]|uniref:Thioredoxin domain-containing protein n=1 Tax=Aquimarina litoralis TaxID=584605 RepID=A0ABP3TTR1_9FLAO
MKKIIILLTFISFGYQINAQTVYYRSVGGTIFSEEKVKEQQQEFYEKFVERNKDVVVEIDVKDTEIKKDSIIHDFGFHIDLNGRTRVKTKLQLLKGSQIPEAILTALDGSQISISDLNGKPTLLNFWFTKCKPCIDEMPELNKLKKEYGDRINFVAITFETKEKVEKFLQKHDFDFVQVVDAQTYLDVLEIKDYPKNVLLNKNGTLRYVKGGIPYIQDEKGEMKMGEATELENKLETLLK